MLARKLRWLFWCSIGLLALFAGAPWIGPGASLAEQYERAVPLLFLPLYLILIYVVTFVTAKKRWRTVVHLKEEKEYELDDAGLHLRCQSANSNCQWNIIQKGMITEHFVYLSMGQNQYHYFPVSAVPDMSQLQALLVDKLGDRRVKRV